MRRKLENPRGWNREAYFSAITHHYKYRLSLRLTGYVLESKGFQFGQIVKVTSPESGKLLIEVSTLGEQDKFRKECRKEWNLDYLSKIRKRPIDIEEGYATIICKICKEKIGRQGFLNHSRMHRVEYCKDRGIPESEMWKTLYRDIVGYYHVLSELDKKRRDTKLLE